MATNIFPATPSEPSSSELSGLSHTTGSQQTTPPSAASPNGLDLPSDSNTIAAVPNSGNLQLRVYTNPSTAPIASIASVNAAAGLSDPFTNLLNREKHGTSDITFEMAYRNNYARIYNKLNDGAIMVESGNFAAVACWAPPAATAKMEVDDGDLSFEAFSQRPIMQRCLREWANVRRKCLGQREYWYMTLMARDPEQRAVKGAVRQVIEIGIRWADQDNKPIWLEAGNTRARDIYAAFGFQEQAITWHGGGGGTGVPIWSMIREPGSGQVA